MLSTPDIDYIFSLLLGMIKFLKWLNIDFKLVSRTCLIDFLIWKTFLLVDYSYTLTI